MQDDQEQPGQDLSRVVMVAGRKKSVKTQAGSGPVHRLSLTHRDPKNVSWAKMSGE